MNNVVIGDLGKLRGEDCLKFDGVDDYIKIDNDISLEVGDIVTIELHDYVPSPNAYLTDYDGLGTRGYLFISTTQTVSNFTPTQIISVGDGVYTFVVHTAVDINTMGARFSLSEFIKAKLRCFKVESSTGVVKLLYIQNGDFGSATLVDHSGNGNDGTIVGAQWWKKDVDENFLTKTAYKSSWAIPMEETQKVVVTTPSEYEPTESTYWNDYNIDPTFDFTVQQQPILSMTYNLLTHFKDGIMKFSRTIKGADLPSSGVHEFNKLPVAIKSTANGSLVVRYEDDADGDFTTISVAADGIFYPVGTIGAIDIDASAASVDLSLVDFGVL